MYRRVVSLLLIPTVLLTQSAGVVHSHGDRQPADHAARPHIHIPFVLFGSGAATETDGHSHSHGPHGHRHRHSPGHHRHADDKPAVPHNSPATPVSDGSEDHDADAIFLVGHDAVVTSPTQMNNPIDGLIAALIALPATPIASEERPEPLLSIAAHPPPLASSVPLHVRHLVFLI